MTIPQDLVIISREIGNRGGVYGVWGSKEKIALCTLKIFAFLLVSGGTGMLLSIPVSWGAFASKGAFFLTEMVVSRGITSALAILVGGSFADQLISYEEGRCGVKHPNQALTVR